MDHFLPAHVSMHGGLSGGLSGSSHLAQEGEHLLGKAAKVQGVAALHSAAPAAAAVASVSVCRGVAAAVGAGGGSRVQLLSHALRHLLDCRGLRHAAHHLHQSPLCSVATPNGGRLAGHWLLAASRSWRAGSITCTDTFMGSTVLHSILLPDKHLCQDHRHPMSPKVNVMF